MYSRDIFGTPGTGIARRVLRALPMVARLKPLAFMAPKKTQKQSRAIPAPHCWPPRLATAVITVMIPVGGRRPVSAAHMVHLPFGRRLEKERETCGQGLPSLVSSIRQQSDCFSPDNIDIDDYRAMLGPVFALLRVILSKALVRVRRLVPRQAHFGEAACVGTNPRTASRWTDLKRK